MGLYFFNLQQMYYLVNLPPDFRAVVFYHALVQFPQSQALYGITLGLRASNRTFSPGYL